MLDEPNGGALAGPAPTPSESRFDFGEWSRLQQELTRRLIRDNDTHLDLRMESRAHGLARGLRRVLANDLLLHLEDSPADALSSAEGTLERLARRLARLNVELNVLKAGLIKQRRFVFHPGDSQANFAIVDASTPASPRPRHSATVALGSMTRGRGWHPPVPREHGRMGRWSGPQESATVILPNIGAGEVRVEWEFEVVEASQARTVAATFNGQAVDKLHLTESGEKRWRAHFEATIQPHERSSFCFLNLSVGSLLPLKTQEPPVMAGLCVESISILPII